MFKKFDVIVVGNYSLDLIFTGLPGLPQLGKELVGTGFEMIPGEAYNSAVAMSRLGVKVGWAADFGNDTFSLFALGRAQAEGLDESLFVHHGVPMRRVSVAASFPEDRAFITYYDPEPRIPAALKALATSSARALYVPGFYAGDLLETGLALARARRMKVLMDGNSAADVRLENPAVRKAVQNLDVLLPNASEACKMANTGALSRALRQLGELCPLVVIKDGPRGAHAIQDGQVIHSPAISVTPVETTGAGDCFNAGFIKAWLDGLPLEQCLRWGNVVGGLSTLGYGGTGYVIHPQDVQPWLKKER